MVADDGSFAKYGPINSERLSELLGNPPTWHGVADFQSSEHIRRIDASVDLDRLSKEAVSCFEAHHDRGDGFHTVNVTRRPGSTTFDNKDLSGRYWLRPHAGSPEEARDELVDESLYSEIVPTFAGTYIEEVVDLLRSFAPIGRVRLLGKDSFNCNSWHRDPEPRLHIPIIANPGSLFIVNNHATHLPADGSVYFTDTRAYHTALNGGETSRISMVAAVAL